MLRRSHWPAMLATCLSLLAAQPAPAAPVPAPAAARSGMVAPLPATTATPSAAATPLPAPEIRIQIDGRLEAFDLPPLLLEGRTLLPLRAVFEQLGAQVTWTESTQTITATRGAHRITLQIGSNQATVDGETVALTVPPLLVDGSTYVPVRFVSESLGSYVTYDAQRQTVLITRSDEPRLGRTRTQIQDRWRTAQPSFTGEPFLFLPSTQPPFQAGALQPGVLDDGLRMLNFVRYLAYLPADVTLDPGYTSLAQHAAVINAYYGTLNHHPERPTVMTEEFYQQALQGSSHANLGAGFRSPADAIQRGYMDDSDPSNIDRLGHRRWILSPRMAKVGFGWLPSPKRYGAFDALYAFDSSRPADPGFTHWAWPAAGYFPTTFFGPEQAWSVGIDPQRVQAARAAVTLTRLSDGKTWQFSAEAADGYFRVDTSGYGYTQAIIFRPADLEQLDAEETYRVTVSGLTDRRGAPFPVQYEVTFFQL